MSSKITLAIEAMRKAFERIEALGVNVKAVAPSLPGPKGTYVIGMKDLSFEERGKASAKVSRETV